MPDLPHPVQIAALPFRLVRGKAAAIEALEEAGVTGKVCKKQLGTYEGWKRLPDYLVMVTVEVYLLEVKVVLETWKEKGQRKRMWAPPAAAAKLVDEPGLAAILADLDIQSMRSRERP